MCKNFLNNSDLIHGKFYKHAYSHKIFYFKFDKIDNELLYTLDNYLIVNNIYIDDYNIKSFDNDLFEKIDINVIIEYLPDTNIDKKNYLRRNKIKFLLNEITTK